MFLSIRSLRRSWVFVLLFLAPFAIADEKTYLWPDASPEQLSEDIFGIKFRLKASRSGQEALTLVSSAMAASPRPFVKAYMGWLVLDAAEFGLPAFPDPAVAETFLRQAHEGGSALGTYLLARVYLTGGAGVARDEETAMKLLEEASGMGYAPAMGLLGSFHYMGRAGRNDAALGDKLVRRAAALGSVDGLVAVGLAFEQRLIPGALPELRAMQYYLLLTDFSWNLGWKKLEEFKAKNIDGADYYQSVAFVRFANDDGTIIPKKVQLHLAALEQSARSEMKGWLELGIAYLKGIYVKKDYPKALAYLQRSANAGMTEAKFFLAYAKANGLGMPVQLEEALREMEKLADAGNVRAAGYLGRLYYWDPVRTAGFKKDKAKAFHYTRLAAEGGWWRALFDLGACYENGIGVKQNYVLATKAYYEAHTRGAKDGYEKMLRNLAFVKD